jgi:hypothetical protein
MTTWKSSSRKQSQTKSRDYLLWSLFATILTAITDSKDDKAIKIKTDPSYWKTTEWKEGRRQTATSTTTYTSRI